MRKAHRCDAYTWYTKGAHHATSPVENAAHQVPPHLKRVLVRKASGSAAYWWYTKGAHRA